MKKKVTLRLTRFILFFDRFSHIYLKQLTSIFFQTILLWLVSYLTLYIDIRDFSNRFMGSVTSLLGKVANYLQDMNDFIKKFILT